MSVRASIMEGNETTFIFSVDVCAVLEQIFDDGYAVVTSGKVQRRRMASVHIAAVDGRWIACGVEDEGEIQEIVESQNLVSMFRLRGKY